MGIEHALWPAPGLRRAAMARRVVAVPVLHCVERAVSKRPIAQLDIENLVEFFQVKVRHEQTIWNFPLFPGSPPLDVQGIVNILAHFTIHTFNGIHYDMPILALALTGADNTLLKAAGDAIILGGLKHWQFYERYQCALPEYVDHVDLFDVAPGVTIGLKMYMGRMHAETMQDLPVAFDKPILPHERLGISTYCDNDLAGTALLGDGVADRLTLREAMSEQYGVDLRSKSDAQIAEAVISSQLAFRPEPRYVAHGYTFNYEPPSYVRFATAPLQALLQTLRTSPFMVSDKEEAHALGMDDVVRTGVQIPDTIKGKDIRIGQGVYRIGIGGLHSQESSVNYQTNLVAKLQDVDVKSYYPSLILSIGMFPTQSGTGFLNIYRKIYDTRLQAKADADKLNDLGLLSEAAPMQTISDGLKIVLNGTFGKLFSKYSKPLYAPELGIRVTITGQLALLMLIEMMELTGIRVVSANTDGIVLLIPTGMEWIVRSNVQWWEKTTGLEMEYTDYQSVWMRDVNNYIAITNKGKAKRKGVFASSGLLSGPQGKHPDKDICADAVVALLKDGTPIETTIRECKDIRKFLQIRQVRGGAIDLPAGVAIADGKYLGKAVRFYNNGRPGYIGTKDTGNKVAGTEGCTPMMTLPDYFPVDVNYGYYIQVATEMLSDIGITQ